MIGALYIAGRSPLHRVRAGWKLALLCLSGLLLFTTDELAPLGIALVVSALALASTGVEFARARKHLTGPLMIIGFLFVATGLLTSWANGMSVALRLGSLVLAGYAITLTTPVSAFLDVIEKALAPLDRIGLVNASKVALSVSLVFRFIPVMLDQARVIREAQAARGLERNVIALLIPLIVHTLKSSDDIASAIDARSYPPPKRALPDPDPAQPPARDYRK